MLSHFADYAWVKGQPLGVDRIADPERAAHSCRIVSDPYHKRLSVEFYSYGAFKKTPYDSAQLDFRHLNPQSQVAWRRVLLKEEESESLSAVHNIDDRVIFLERAHFLSGHCVRTDILSTQHQLLATQIVHNKRDASFVGVILLDRIEKPVMWKRYRLGEDGEFSEQLEEQWDMLTAPPPIDQAPLT
jgi:hypothetical protein